MSITRDEKWTTSRVQMYMIYYIIDFKFGCFIELQSTSIASYLFQNKRTFSRQNIPIHSTSTIFGTRLCLEHFGLENLPQNSITYGAHIYDNMTSTDVADPLIGHVFSIQPSLAVAKLCLNRRHCQSWVHYFC